MKILFALLACALCGVANAAPPPAPVITVAATDVRQLEFNWTPVSGVQSYELWFRSAVGAPWVKYDERAAQLAPLFRIGVAVHLLNWSTANFFVKACNVGGCSSSNVVGVNGERYAAIGFFKPRQTEGVKYFGNSVALSADGYTMAVTASEAIVRDTVIVHVYRRTTRSSAWRLQARLRPSILQPDTGQYLSGGNLSLSADGNVLVLGYDTFGGCTNTSHMRVGSVDVFRRSGSTWNHSQYLRGCEDGERFGSRLEIDDAGRTLAIYHIPSGRYQEGGAIEIYRAPAGGTQFTHEMSLPPPPCGTDQRERSGLALSGDGSTLVRGCTTSSGSLTYVHTGAGFAQSAVLESTDNLSYDLNYDGTALLVQDFEGAQAYRLGTGGWQREAVLTDGPGPDLGTNRVAISRDGKIAVIGNFSETTVGRGPLNPPFRQGPEEGGTGGVFVFQYKSGGWQLRRLVKPGSYNVGYAGMSVALSGNGNVLAVAAPLDPSAAAGIDGNRGDASAPQRGAVWLY
jgi:hypothetical protein